MARTFLFWLLMTILLIPSAPAEAQRKIPRIGFLVTTGEGIAAETFQRGLGDLGYNDGKNIVIEYRYHEGKMDLITNFVAELVQLKVDVLFADSPPAIFAAKRATIKVHKI